MSATQADQTNREFDEIASVIETYRAGFETMDAQKLQSIWDPDYPTIYCPIELDRPLRGKAEIYDYYEQVTRHFSGVSIIRVDDVTIDGFGDHAYAFFTFHFEGATHASDEPFVVDGRTTLVLRAWTTASHGSVGALRTVTFAPRPPRTHRTPPA